MQLVLDAQENEQATEGLGSSRSMQMVMVCWMISLTSMATGSLADVLQANAPAAALPGGLIHTGLSGRGGCGLGTGGGPFYPLLALMAVLAAGGMLFRRRRPEV